MNEFGHIPVAKYIKRGILGFVGFIVFLIVINMYNSVSIGYTTVYQNSLTGKEEVYHGPDFFISMPFFSSSTEYKDDTTLSFSPENERDSYTFTSGPIDVTFADTYKAKVLVNARAQLPADREQMLALHKAFRSYNNLVNSLYNKTLIDVTVNTTQQFTAEEIFQGGLNGLKSAIEDQAKNGVYVTERRKVLGSEGVTDRTEIGGKKTDSTTKEKAVYVWKAIPKVDSNNQPMRTSNPFGIYGITISQVNLAEPIPEQTLNDLLLTKKQLVAVKIASIQKQENAKTEIETAKLEGEAARVKAEQDKLIAADAEIIEQKKQVDVAKQQALKETVERQKLADLAIIDKKKELQMAQDDEKIQHAKERAAKFEAQKLLHLGLADAQIIAARYKAYNQTLYAMEIQKDTMLGVTQNMRDIKIQMPYINIAGSNGKANTSFDTIMNAVGIKNLQDLAQKSK